MDSQRTNWAMMVFSERLRFDMRYRFIFKLCTGVYYHQADISRRKEVGMEMVVAPSMPEVGSEWYCLLAACVASCRSLTFSFSNMAWFKWKMAKLLLSMPSLAAPKAPLHRC
jgi:hypothetical protein